MKRNGDVSAKKNLEWDVCGFVQQSKLQRVLCSLRNNLRSEFAYCRLLVILFCKNHQTVVSDCRGVFVSYLQLHWDLLAFWITTFVCDQLTSLLLHN